MKGFIFSVLGSIFAFYFLINLIATVSIAFEYPADCKNMSANRNRFTSALFVTAPYACEVSHWLFDPLEVKP